jgi:hypothetical protein
MSAPFGYVLIVSDLLCEVKLAWAPAVDANAPIETMEAPQIMSVCDLVTSLSL